MDGNQELAGIGSANLAAGLFSGFPVSTSGSRTAVAGQSGAKTQLTGLVAAALVLLMLLFVPGLVQAMPQPVLAAVIIAASISLFDVAELAPPVPGPQDRVRARGRMRPRRRVHRRPRRASSSRSSCPSSTSSSASGRRTRRVLGKAPDVPGYHDIGRYPDTEQVPGLLILRWSAPLFFANANQFRDRIRELVKAADPAPQWVLVAAEPITDIDTTAGAMLADLDLELNAAGIHLAFAELQSGVRDMIERYELYATIDEGHFYQSVTEAVDALRHEMDQRS